MLNQIASEGGWLRLLNGISADVRRAESIDQLADCVVRSGIALGFARARLWRLTPDGVSLIGMSQAGDPAGGEFRGLSIALHESPYSQQVLQAREPQYFDGEQLGAWMLPRYLGPEKFAAPIGQWVHMPLWAGAHCWGMLTLDNADQPGAITPERRLVLSLFGQQIAAAIEHTSLAEELRRREQERDWLEELIHIGADEQRTTSFDETTAIIIAGGRRLGFERVRLWLLSEDHELLIAVAQAGCAGLDAFEAVRFPRRASKYIERVIVAKQPVFFRGEEHGPGYLSRTFRQQGYQPPAGDWVGIPLLSNQQLVGVLMLDNAAAPRVLDRDQQKLLALFGQQAAAALDRARKAYERTWFSIISDTIAAAQHVQTLREAAELLAQGGRRLDFDRVRLWLLSADGQYIDGLSESGNDSLPNFQSLHVEYTQSHFSQHMDGAREPRFFRGIEEGDTYLVRTYPGFAAPVGDWVSLPLWTNDRMFGILTLDNIHRPRVLYPGQRDLLQLFGRQGAAVLERAQLYEADRRQQVERKWLATLSAIAERTQQASTLPEAARAIVQGGLSLGFVRARLWQLSADGSTIECICQTGADHVADLVGATLSIGQADYAREILVGDRPKIFPWRGDLPVLIDRQLAARGFAPPADERIGVPLWNNDRCFGLLVLDYGEQPFPPEQRDRLDLIELFGRQAAAALERVRRAAERDWLEQLSLVASELQLALKPESVQEAILHGAQRLGFARARLWRLRADAQTLEGVCQIGTAGLEDFANLVIRRSDSLYIRKMLASPAPVTFYGHADGPDILSQHYAAHGYRSPRGGWVGLRLGIGKVEGSAQWRGVLVLDNGDDARRLSAEQEQLLNLFARQAEAALERARLYEDGVLERAQRQLFEKLNAVANRLQRARGLQSVAAIVVRGAQDLGFVRARLWQLSDDKRHASGVAQWGDPDLDNFAEMQADTGRSPYMQKVLAGAGIEFFQGASHGTGVLEDHYGSDKFHPPLGEWAGIRIGLGQQWQGLLFLDHGQLRRPISEAQRNLLGWLRQQAEAAIERARLYEEEQRQRFESAWLKELHDVGRELQRARQLHEVADVVVRGVQRLGFMRARLWQLSDDGQTVRGVAQWGSALLEDFETRTTSRSHSPYIQKVLTSGDGIEFFDGTQLGAGVLDEQARPAVGEWVGIRIGAGQHWRGVLFLDRDQKTQSLTSAQRGLIGLFGRQAEAALERARLYEEEERQRSESAWLKDLAEVASKLQPADTLEKVAEQIVAGSEPLEFERARLWRLSDDGEAIIGVSQRGSPELAPFERVTLPLAGEPSSRAAIEQRRPRVFQGQAERQSQLDALFLERGFRPPVGEWVELPLIVQERVWGLLTLDNASAARTLTGAQSNLISLFARQAEAAIERVEQDSRLRFLTMAAARIAWAAEIAHDVNSELSHIRSLVDRMKRLPSCTYRDLRRLGQGRDPRLAALAARLDPAAAPQRALDAAWAMELAQVYLDDLALHAGRLAITFTDTRAAEGEIDTQPLAINEWLARELPSIPLGQDAELRLRLAEGERTVATNPMVLRRVLLHLARNAREAMRPHGGTITVRTLFHAAAVEIRLEDTGPGVPADVRLALFQRQITTKNRPGGLGLMFVRIMLEGLGCRIKLLPSAAGAVFAIELPSAL
ncbi:MAG TPA: GAF domain-containing protein [Kouleothrix sp.]|nr:GAF domain-containing protein [Kouleothrix sp.]